MSTSASKKIWRITDHIWFKLILNSLHFSRTFSIAKPRYRPSYILNPTRTVHLHRRKVARGCTEARLHRSEAGQKRLSFIARNVVFIDGQSLSRGQPMLATWLGISSYVTSLLPVSYCAIVGFEEPSNLHDVFSLRHSLKIHSLLAPHDGKDWPDGKARWKTKCQKCMMRSDYFGMSVVVIYLLMYSIRHTNDRRRPWHI